MPRIQTYVDELTFQKIQDEAKKNGLSTSKYLSNLVVTSHKNTSRCDFATEKTHQLLAHIWNCVYDEGIHKANAKKIKSLLKHVELDVLEKTSEQVCS